MTNNTSLMTFPCVFQIKVIGKNTANFVEEIIIITRKHYPDFTETDVKIQPSQQDNYLALSITLQAQDQATLDALYLNLTKHPDIKMVL